MSLHGFSLSLYLFVFFLKKNWISRALFLFGGEIGLFCGYIGLFCGRYRALLLTYRAFLGERQGPFVGV